MPLELFSMNTFLVTVGVVLMRIEVMSYVKTLVTELAVVLCCLILPRGAIFADDWPH